MRLRMRGVQALLLGAALAAAGAGGARGEERRPAALPELRLIHVRDGLRDAAPQGDLARAGETEVGRLASAVGLDLLRPEHPLLAATYGEGRLFYVFWKTTLNAFGDRPYVIQRIRKVERTWTTPQGPPQEATTYQVEVFKLLGGALKRPDQHHGSFALRDAVRRQIVKEYEIGFGEIPGVASGAGWPFPDGSLYRLTQAYQADPGQHPQVAFVASRRWSLDVTFAKDGTWSVASPELGFRAPAAWPEPAAALPTPDESSSGVVLEPGRGFEGARIGESTAEALIKALGRPLDDSEAGRGHRLLSFPRSLSLNLNPDGRLKTVITRPGFKGRTAGGVTHGSTRAEVLAKSGPPKGQPADAQEWTYPGLVVRFDAFDRVVRLVVFAAP